jgi:hypothetical protein
MMAMSTSFLPPNYPNPSMHSQPLLFVFGIVVMVIYYLALFYIVSSLVRLISMDNRLNVLFV